MVKLRSGLAGRNASSPSIVKVLKLIQVVFSLSTELPILVSKYSGSVELIMLES